MDTFIKSIIPLLSTEGYGNFRDYYDDGVKNGVFRPDAHQGYSLTIYGRWLVFVLLKHNQDNITFYDPPNTLMAAFNHYGWDDSDDW